MEGSSVRRIVIVTSLTTVIIVAVVAAGGYFLYQHYLASRIATYELEKQSKTVLAQVGEVVQLPTDETPQVATVLDASELQDSDPFFEKAQNGDALLMYKKRGLIVLFDLNAHKVLNMGLIATGTDATNTIPADSLHATQ